ncbi:hypothetical protein B296_00049013 [Ensete ventricosum]|uniref:Protein kinase domain-containing protein n=1 Tax=Ensete ventricosum TaxID=4639 RepID=A0A426YSL9_ENSVE|nr:hypothetical protein B296_00049013 [Ensete ventricosum]
MDRKANLPAPPASDRPSAADANCTSSSSCTFSPPEFLRQAHAVFKRHRPLGGMQSKICRATRVLVPQTEPSDSMTSMSTITTNETAKAVPLTGSVVGVRRIVKALIYQRESRAIAVAGLLEDASINPPSVTETLTVAGDDKASTFGLQKSNIDLMADRKQSSLVVMSSQVPPPHALMDNDMKQEILTFQRVESYLGTQVETNEQELTLQNHGNLEVFGTSMKFGGTSLLENTKEPKHDQCYVEPMSRCSVLDSSCATSLSVNTGPTFQSTHAQPAGQTSFLTEVSSSAKEMSSSINDHVPMEELRAVKNGCDWDTDREHNRHLAESVKEKGLCGDANYLPSQAPLTNNPSSNIEVCPSQSSKVEKYRHKKKYDPNVFFKVNGKLYQKLGKIGSGGSSEVHKVISSDCTIYALKKIRLKGRDYPTAYGFCQEIEYLNRLKGKSNIIQLVDYEVKKKTLAK